MKTLVTQILTASGLAFALVAATGCTAYKVATPEVSESIAAPARMSTLNVNMYPVNKLVCDPFGGTPDPRPNAGLQAELFYLNPNQSRFYSAGEYISHGHKSSQNLFFSTLNVPTRLFDKGFSTEAGDVVRDDNGNKLIEFFALRFKTVLKLSASQEEGLYQIAVLSDDGVRIRMRDDEGQWQELINNDGDHPTRLGCGNQVVQMNRNTERLLEIDYYQGPRYHISAILMMRKADAQLSAEPRCGQTGNSHWFNPDANSAPQPAYQDLLSRGWAPMSADNFALPIQAQFNPCKEGVAPIISNFRQVEAARNTIWLAWTTDRPATSQVLYTDPVTGVRQITESDNVLRTSHYVMVQGLNPSTFYQAQAVSISEDYGRALSAIINARTSD